MNVVKIKDQNGKEVKAKVGDTIAAYCISSNRICVGEIERIKNGIQAAGMKHFVSPKKCVWLNSSTPLESASDLKGGLLKECLEILQENNWRGDLQEAIIKQLEGQG